MATAKKPTVKKAPPKKVEKKPEVNPWKVGLSAEKYNTMLELELEHRAKGKGCQVAPDLSVAEHKDYVNKFPKMQEYLEAPKTKVTEAGVRERNASVK